MHLQLVWTPAAPPSTSESNTFRQSQREEQTQHLPSREQLQALLVVTRSGSIRKTRQAIEALRQTNRNYHAFADSLFHLARQFKIEEIEDVLQQHLAEGNHDLS